jgi:uncharacterized membrane protein
MRTLIINILAMLSAIGMLITVIGHALRDHDRAAHLMIGLIILGGVFALLHWHAGRTRH